MRSRRGKPEHRVQVHVAQNKMQSRVRQQPRKKQRKPGHQADGGEQKERNGLVGHGIVLGDGPFSFRQPIKRRNRAG